MKQDAREQSIYPTQAALKISKQLEKTGNQLYQQMIDTMGEPELIAIVQQLQNTRIKIK